VGRRGGGVALYIREEITSAEILENRESVQVESVWVRLTVHKGKRNIVVGVCSRPPGQAEEEEEALMKQIINLTSKKDSIVMGDFNYLDINWETHSAGSTKSRKFIDRLEEGYLSQAIREGTRGNNTLDLILTNRDEMLDEIQVLGTVGGSDHQL